MSKVECLVQETTLPNESGFKVDGVSATCRECGHKTKSFGTGESSVKRCLALLRDECLYSEDNFYVNEEE